MVRNGSAIVVAFVVVGAVVCKCVEAQDSQRDATSTRHPRHAPVVAPRDGSSQVPPAPHTYAESLRLCNGSTADMVDCNTARLNHAESELRAVSDRVVRELSTQGHDGYLDDSLGVGAFLLAQDRWRAFRDAECEWRYGVRIGTMYTVLKVECLGDMTRARMRELRAHLRGLRQWTQ